MPTVEDYSALSIESLPGGVPIPSLDMAGLLLDAYELGDMIKGSAEVADYLYWKSAVEQDGLAQRDIAVLAKAKEAFEECERFGRFHPDFHAARGRVKEAQAQVDAHESVRRFKDAEQQLEEILYDVSRMIAEAVSNTIKVPGGSGSSALGGCGSGGSCSCGSGGCG